MVRIAGHDSMRSMAMQGLYTCHLHGIRALLLVSLGWLVAPGQSSMNCRTENWELANKSCTQSYMVCIHGIYSVRVTAHFHTFIIQL